MLTYQYTNHYGERWVFEYDPAYGRGVIRGSDINWEAYPVVDGIAVGLVLNGGEQEWLRRAWDEATQPRPQNYLYLGRATEFVFDDRGCYLTNQYCPICLEVRDADEFEMHHCIWRFEGGPDQGINLLRVCKSCHALITRGNKQDRVPRDLAALHHQLMYFGVDLFLAVLQSGNMDKLRLIWPRIATATGEYAALSSDERGKVQELITRESRAIYQYYRDMVRGKWSWRAHRERMRLSGGIDSA